VTGRRMKGRWKEWDGKGDTQCSGVLEFGMDLLRSAAWIARRFGGHKF
jgi:hypothetical protein